MGWYVLVSDSTRIRFFVFLRDFQLMMTCSSLPGTLSGNVPANYRTNDNPPRALGRWINRQRSAYVKDKLKSEYVEKLNKIGLKWSVHERRPMSGADAVTSSTTSVAETVALPGDKKSQEDESKPKVDNCKREDDNMTESEVNPVAEGSSCEVNKDVKDGGPVPDIPKSDKDVDTASA